MSQRRIYRTTPPLVATTDLEVAEGDGCRVKVGRMVYQPPKWSETMRVFVPSRTGRVTRVYLREGDSRPLVDTANGHILEASRCRRSAAQDE